MTKVLRRDESGRRIITRNDERKVLSREGDRVTISKGTPSKKKVVRVGDYITEVKPTGETLTYKTGQKVGASLLTESQKRERSVRPGRGTVRGRVYDNLQYTEILAGKLLPNSRAKLNVFETKRRNEYISASSRVRQGQGTSRDLIRILGRGREIKNIVLTSDRARALILKNEYVKNLNDIARKYLSQKEKDFYKSLKTIDKRRSYLKKVLEFKEKISDTAYKVTPKTLTETEKENFKKLKTEKERKAYLQSILKKRVAKFDFIKTQEEKPVVQFIKGIPKPLVGYAKSLGVGFLKLIRQQDKNGKSLLDAPIFKQYWKTKAGKQHEKFILTYDKLTSVEKKKLLADQDVQTLLITTGLLFLPQSKVLTALFKVVGAVGGTVLLGKTGLELYLGQYGKAGESFGGAILLGSLLFSRGANANYKIKQIPSIPNKISGVKQGTILVSGNQASMVVKGGNVVNFSPRISAQIIARSKGGKVKLPANTPKDMYSYLLKTKPKAAAPIKGKVVRAKLNSKEMKILRENIVKYSKSNLKKGKKIIDLFINLEKTFPGTKAQAGRGKRISKAALRRRNAGLPPKQRRLNVDKGEYIIKNPKKGGRQESLRFNPSTKELTLKQTSKYSSHEVVLNQKGQQVSDKFTLGKFGSTKNLKKKYQRPASQIKTKKDIEEMFILYRNSPTILKSFTEFKNNKQMLEQLAKPPKEVQTGKGAVQMIRTKGKTKKEAPQGKKPKTPKLAQQQRAKATGRERVRQQLINKLKEKKKAFDKAKAPKSLVPTIPKKTPAKVTKVKAKRKVTEIKKQVKTVSSKIKKLDSTLKVAENKFARIGKVSNNALFSISSSSKILGNNIFRVNGNVFSLIAGLGLNKDSARDSDILKDVAKLNDQTNDFIKDYIQINKRINQIKVPKPKVPKTPKIRQRARQQQQPKKVTKVKPKPKPKPKAKKKQIKQKLKPIKFPLIFLNWNSKLPKGYSLIVNARYKKGNKVLTKQLRTTPNRAKKLMAKFVDERIIRSFDLVVIGAKKVKDIKPPKLKKFRLRKGTDPKVRKWVELTKYSLDKPKEKAISKLPKKRKKTVRKVNKKRKL